MNETHYSHQFEQILDAFVQLPNIRAKIVATGVVKHYASIDSKLYFLPVFPLSFHEFIVYKHIRIDHITMHTTSKLLLKELQ